MSWTSDPELQQMFVSELEERSARLLDGAREMQAGDLGNDTAGVMLREGHTIKGTSRVMGFEVLSHAGQLIEQLWRRIQQGETETSAELGAALEAVASSIPEAATADPDKGTHDLVVAINTLHEVSGSGADPLPVPEDSPVDAPPVDESPDPVEEPAPVVEDESPTSSAASVDAPEATSAPEPPVEPAPEPAIAPDTPATPEAASADVIPLRPDIHDDADGKFTPAAAAPSNELGGLLGALESWATEQTMAVNAGRLYRLINRIADVRNELGSVQATVGEEGDAAGPVEHLAGTIADLQHDALALAAVPLSGMTNSLPQLVRYLAKKLDKDVRFEVVGDDDVAIDRQVIDIISDPVRQLIVNAIRHGVEPTQTRKKLGKPTTGSVSMSTAVKDRRLEIVITDDGAGIDWETVRAQAIEQGLYPAGEGVDVDKLRAILFSNGFSTVTPSELGGGGAGLSTVATAVEALFGRIKLESTAGVGTTVTVTVPTSRALQRVLMVEEAGIKWGIPEALVDEVVPLHAAEIGPLGLDWHGRQIDVVAFNELVRSSRNHSPAEVVIASHRLGELAITTEHVLGVREVAVKELGPLLSGPSHISGAALLGGGDVVLVLDAAQMFDRSAGEPGADATGAGARVLVVDDSLGARAVVSGALASSGFTTSVASSVAEALEILNSEGADAVVVDFSMPHEDGIALVDQVRDQFADLPVVMLSGVATREDQDRAQRAGVDAFFEKADFREGALAEALRKMLDARGQVG